LIGTPSCDFSFSGLKTAVRHRILALGAEAGSPATMADLCASFQAAVGDVLVDRAVRALRRFAAEHPAGRTLVLAGGVAANRHLRQRLEAAVAGHGFRLLAPPLPLCTDNAVMVAWAGIERLRLGEVDDQAVPARARWPLEELTPP
jgi:N6-L-threonylcarbamoyladenine synthase